MNLAAHQEDAYQAIIDVTIIRIVPIIAMKPDVATAMEVMEMEVMEMEVIHKAVNKDMKVLFTFLNYKAWALWYFRMQLQSI